MISFRGGLQEIPDALARELHAEMRLRAPVTQLRARAEGVDGRRGVSGAGAVRREWSTPRRRTAWTRSTSTSRAESASTLSSILHPAGRGARAGLPAGAGGPSARRFRLPGSRGRAPAGARRDLLLHAVPRPRAGRARDADGVRRRYPRPRLRPTPTRRHSPLGCWTTCGSARHPGRADLPRLPALAQGDSAVRPRLRQVQGDRGRRGAAQSRAGAGRDVSRRSGPGRRDRLGRRGGRRGSPTLVARGQAVAAAG